MSKKKLNDLKIVDKKTPSDIYRYFFYKKNTLIILLATLLLGVIVSSGLILKLNKFENKIPDLSILEKNFPKSSKIYDKNNQIICYIYDDEKKENISISQISKNLQNAVIAIEDIRFHSHNGIDLKGTIRAISSNTISNSTQGGSTITQQLAKNVFLKPSKNIKRKIIEAILAIKIEDKYSKEKILEMYLNKVYWGSLVYGAQAASKLYFNKDASDLTIAESALLAGLLKAPEGLSPYRNYKQAKIRQIIVLNKMLEAKFITKEQFKNAIKEPLKLTKPNYSNKKYGYFTHYIKSQIVKQYGSEILKRGGLEIYSTLDVEIQETAEKTLQEYIDKLNKPFYQGAMVNIDVETGNINAIVGGYDYHKSNYNRAFQANRCVGSLFKPIVYLTALENGIITPETEVLDAPITLRSRYFVWSPKNWDRKYKGKLTARMALALSRNTPAVRIALKTGIDPIIENAKKLGISDNIQRNYSIVLGSLGSSPLKIAGAFNTFARKGSYIEPQAIRLIRGYDGQVLSSYEGRDEKQIFSPENVEILNSMLKDVVKVGTGKRAQIEGLEVAGKTGTTDKSIDIWFSGFTPQTVTTVWIGRDDNKSIRGLSSSFCAQIWKEFTVKYYEINDSRQKNSANNS